MPQLRFRFDAVFYYASDIDRTVKFYAEVFGLKPVSRDVVARFDLDGVLFEVAPAHGPFQGACTGNARLCLAVDDLAETMAELKARGVRTHPMREVSNGWLAGVEDPDGNEICLWQYR